MTAAVPDGRSAPDFKLALRRRLPDLPNRTSIVFVVSMRFVGVCVSDPPPDGVVVVGVVSVAPAPAGTSAGWAAGASAGAAAVVSVAATGGRRNGLRPAPGRERTDGGPASSTAATFAASASAGARDGRRRVVGGALATAAQDERQRDERGDEDDGDRPQPLVDEVANQGAGEVHGVTWEAAGAV